MSRLTRPFSSFLLVVLLAAGLPAAPARADGCLTAVDVPGCLHGLPADQYNGLLGQMQANPWPAVRPVAISISELERYSFWKLDRESVTFYYSPGGMAIETINPGYSFVSPLNIRAGYMEVAPDRWVSMGHLTEVQASRHAGVEFDWPLAYPMAWLIRGTAASAAPGLKPTRQSPILSQYTRVNIFATVAVDGWEWYLVGPGMWIEQRNVGRIIPTAPPAGVGGRWVAVDLYEQVLTAYEGDRPVYATLISSGDNRWPTNEGLFQIWAKMSQDSMTGAMGRPDFYNIPVVPYVMYFDGGIALHGAFWHNVFGYKHSHGCVNMSVSDARWLFSWSAVGTPVLVWRSR